MKSEERNDARQLRKNGASLNKIARSLNVSKGTVSVWVRDIILTKEQVSLMNRGSSSGRKKGSETRSRLTRERRENWRKEGTELAKESADFVKLCLLYWTEGSKSRNCVSFCNTDSSMIYLFIKLLRQIFPEASSKINYRVNAYTNNGLSFDDIQNFWGGLLDLPLSKRRKGQENNFPISSSRGKNKHLYGVCNISVNSTEIVQKIFGGIMYIGNCYDAVWLNK